MTNPELNEILKAAQVPARPSEYWDQFPKQVMTQCQLRDRWPEAGKSRQLFELDQWADVLAIRVVRHLAGAVVYLALICAGLVLVLRWIPESHRRSDGAQFTQARTYFHEVEALFPNQLQTIVFDENGPRLLLSERPDVPGSLPLYVKICGAIGCHRFVTFSGQRISFAGQEFEVLLTAQGEVLLIGEKSGWSTRCRRDRRRRW